MRCEDVRRVDSVDEHDLPHDLGFKTPALFKDQGAEVIKILAPCEPQLALSCSQRDWKADCQCERGAFNRQEEHRKNTGKAQKKKKLIIREHISGAKDKHGLKKRATGQKEEAQKQSHVTTLTTVGYKEVG